MSQVFNRTRNFLLFAQNSNNEKVNFITEVSRDNPNSLTSINISVLSQQIGYESTQNDIRIRDQIFELNECLDGDRNCGLNQNEIQTVLSFIGLL